jgi:hypothetical protein
MLRLPHAALVLACLLALCRTAPAGVYVTTPPDPFPVVTAQEKVKDRLSTLTMLGDSVQKAVSQPTTERQKLVKQVETALEPKYRAGELTLADRVNLSAAYIRLGRHAKAVLLLKEVLEGPQPVKEDAPERFLLMANLAAALNDGNAELLPRAIFAQDAAIKAAPAKPPVAGWSQEQWDRYRIVDNYYLKLLQLRRGEGKRAATWKTVDALFEKVQFVGPGGEFEAGKLSAEILHELPRDALPIVVQLLYWLPTDSRLYWLYGELLNAEGRINEAYQVLDELTFARGLSAGIRELRQHRQILMEAKKAVAPAKADEPLLPTEEPKPAANPAAKPATEWRTLAIGFVTGLLVAAFGGLQLYLWLRRRVPARAAAALAAAPASFAAAGKAEGITPDDPGHVTAPRDRS